MIDFARVFCLFLIAGWLSCGSCNAQLEDPIRVGPKIVGEATSQQINAARLKLQQAESQYETNLKLAKRGSVSQSALKRSKLRSEIARLELNVYQHPEFSDKARAEIAKRNLQLAVEELNIGKALQQRGSMSNLKLRRLEYQVKIAEILYKASSREYSAQAANLLLADTKLELARSELQLAKQMYQRRSLSKAKYQAIVERVREAELKKSNIERKYQQQQNAIRKTRGT